MTVRAGTPILAPVDSAIVAKVSRRLIPYLFVLYVAAYLDRINIGFAQLQMRSALGFSDTVYGFGAGVFFLGYFLFEVPSNLILARTGARIWIARIMITWGLISSAMAFVETPVQFYVLRFLLGVAEAGFFPGVIYYLGQWFPASARAAAISRFMTAAAVSGIIGGPLSAALFTLDGVSGLAGWQWIFMAEGVPSVVLGLTTLWFLTDRPSEARWLTADERTTLMAHIQREADTTISRHGATGAVRALLHPTVWRLSLLSFTLLIGLYSISFWLPQLVQSVWKLGNFEVALLSAVPYIAAAIAMVTVGTHSDRTGERHRHIAGAALVGAAGLALSAIVQTPVAGLIALSIAAVGIFSAIPVFWTLPAAFLTGQAAAGAIALINSFGNLGGFAGPFFIGAMKDVTGGFAASLLTISGVLVGSAWLSLRLRHVR